MRATERVIRLELALYETLAKLKATEAERARLEAALRDFAAETTLLSVRMSNATMTPEKLKELLEAKS